MLRRAKAEESTATNPLFSLQTSQTRTSQHAEGQGDPQCNPYKLVGVGSTVHNTNSASVRKGKSQKTWAQGDGDDAGDCGRCIAISCGDNV